MLEASFFLPNAQSKQYLRRYRQEYFCYWSNSGWSLIWLCRLSVQEDLTPESVVAIVEKLRKGEKPPVSLLDMLVLSTYSPLAARPHIQFACDVSSVSVYFRCPDF
jgi:hypothetical protein